VFTFQTGTLEQKVFSLQILMLYIKWHCYFFHFRNWHD